MDAAARHVEDLDVNRYPRTAAYLAQLPHGLDSFPDCAAKTTIHRTVYAHARDTLTGLGPVLQPYLDTQPETRWMPQCHTLALIIALVESRALGPEAERAWIREAAGKLFSTPMYKVLMWAVSPRLLIRGADIRWSAFFRGSTLNSTVNDQDAELQLLAPPGLFDGGLALIFTDVLRSALNYTEHDAGTARIELRGFEPGCVRYHAEW